MNPVLADVIRRFRAARDRGVATLVGRLGVPLPASNRQWVADCAERGLYRTRQLNCVTTYAHGYGIELALEVTIDWDWGDHGEPDGFDDWRLWNFVRENNLAIGCDNSAQIREWLEDALEAGELSRDRLLC